MNFLMNVLVDREAMIQRFGEYDENNPSVEAILSHRQMNALMQVFCKCPPFNQGHTNNSKNIQGMIRMAGHYEHPESTAESSEVEQLLRQLHIRIETKFSDYRTAFRAFDLNFDGGLNF